jgi:hypothetical protein
MFLSRLMDVFKRDKKYAKVDEELLESGVRLSELMSRAQKIAEASGMRAYVEVLRRTDDDTTH